MALDQLKSVVHESFDNIRKALDIREKLLIRQIEVLFNHQHNHLQQQQLQQQQQQPQQQQNEHQTGIVVGSSYSHIPSKCLKTIPSPSSSSSSDVVAALSPNTLPPSPLSSTPILIDQIKFIPDNEENVLNNIRIFGKFNLENFNFSTNHQNHQIKKHSFTIMEDYICPNIDHEFMYKCLKNEIRSSYNNNTNNNHNIKYNLFKKTTKPNKIRDEIKDIDMERNNHQTDQIYKSHNKKSSSSSSKKRNHGNNNNNGGAAAVAAIGNVGFITAVDFANNTILFKENANNLNDSIINITLNESKELIDSLSINNNNKKQLHIDGGGQVTKHNEQLNLNQRKHFQSKSSQTDNGIQNCDGGGGGGNDLDVVENIKNNSDKKIGDIDDENNEILIHNCKGTINLNNIANVTINNVYATKTSTILNDDDEDQIIKTKTLNPKSIINNNNIENNPGAGGGDNTECEFYKRLIKEIENSYKKNRTKSGTTNSTATKIKSKSSQQKTTTTIPLQFVYQRKCIPEMVVTTSVTVNEKQEKSPLKKLLKNTIVDIPMENVDPLVNQPKNSKQQQQQQQQTTTSNNKCKHRLLENTLSATSSTSSSSSSSTSSSSSSTNSSESKSSAKSASSASSATFSSGITSISTGLSVGKYHQKMHPIQIQHWLKQIIFETEIEPIQNVEILEHSKIN